MVTNLFRRKQRLFHQSLSRWRGDRGDETLKLDFDLDQTSIVLDVGGYRGQWSSDLYARYRCKIFVFEPITEFYEFTKRRFAKNPDVIVLKQGLSGKTRSAKISKQADASSIFKESVESESIELVSLSDFFAQNALNHIDLMGINAEGGEYELLNHLMVTGLVSKIDNLLVQFHDFMPDAKTHMEEIQRQLSATHSPVYQYPFVWEHWRISA